MEPRDLLLDRFEKTIDLPAYLASRGFELSKQQPDRDHIAMHGPKGEVLLLQKDLDRGVWTYTAPASPAEGGSVVTFLERREGLDRKAALELLVACADERRRDVPAAVQYRDLVRAKPDDLRHAETTHLVGAERRRGANKVLERLGVPVESFDARRFGAVRDDSEVARLITEPKQGTLWPSQYRPTDRKLVLVERPIDAVAYERRCGAQQACYIATGGTLDEEKKRRLAHVLAEVRGGIEVVIGYGRDRQGEDLAAQVRGLSPMLHMERQGPEFGARWADQMQVEARHDRSLKRGAGAGRALDRGIG